MGIMPRPPPVPSHGLLTLVDRKVYKARCRKTGRMVALKKIRMEAEKDGVHPAVLPGRCHLYW